MQTTTRAPYSQPSDFIIIITIAFGIGDAFVVLTSIVVLVIYGGGPVITVNCLFLYYLQSV